MAGYMVSSGNIIGTSSCPITSYPFSMACWAYPGSGGVVLGMQDPTSNASYQYYSLPLPGLAWIAASADLVNSISVNTATPPTANKWHFAVAVFPNTTDVRLYVLFPSGAVEAAATLGGGPVLFSSAAVTMMMMGGLSDGAGGASNSYTGGFAEMWFTSSDVSNGGRITKDYIRQIAYSGPFSHPEISNKLVAYRSFRRSLLSAEDNASDAYVGFGPAPLKWTQITGISADILTGAHPPLPYRFRRPKSEIKLGIV